MLAFSNSLDPDSLDDISVTLMTFRNGLLGKNPIYCNKITSMQRRIAKVATTLLKRVVSKIHFTSLFAIMSLFGLIRVLGSYVKTK